MFADAPFAGELPLLLEQATIISTLFEVRLTQFGARTAFTMSSLPFTWSFSCLCSPGVTLLSAEERPQPAGGDTTRLWQWHNVLPGESDRDRMWRQRNRWRKRHIWSSSERLHLCCRAPRCCFLTANHRTQHKAENSQIRERASVKCWSNSSLHDELAAVSSWVLTDLQTSCCLTGCSFGIKLVNWFNFQILGFICSWEASGLHSSHFVSM